MRTFFINIRLENLAPRQALPQKLTGLMSTTMKRIRPLTEVEGTGPTTVARMKLPEDELKRLVDLGLHEGSSVRVLERNENSPLLIAVGDGRIGVSWPVAKKIYVY